MPCFICNTCGTQYADQAAPPPACTICSEPRQYVPASGQSWTTLDKLRQSHHNYWLKLQGGTRLLRLGGHFEGGTVLHWPQGNEGRGTLLSGDILQVVPDRRHVSFMWSYPNYLPLPAFAVRRMQDRLGAYAFDAVYGAFWDAEITEGGQAAVAESFRRYLSMLERGTLG